MRIFKILQFRKLTIQKIARFVKLITFQNFQNSTIQKILKTIPQFKISKFNNFPNPTIKKDIKFQNFITLKIQ